ncbi:CocE/NonD family hydrolase [Nonomuraea sp. NPDC050556]|uniref:CocE/NonD family hydrolase n=1 Tax=Nonomuraea sp. NPDC050556 TaxID=3364369 RepID=UPI0037BD2FCF
MIILSKLCAVVVLLLTSLVGSPAYDTAIKETAWVELDVDLDRDGHKDRLAADIIRPSSAGRVPVLMDISPYYACCGRGNEAQKKTYDADGKPVAFPLYYDNYFVPRGYAVLLVDMSGTNRSTGCMDDGGPYDLAAGAQVIKWLNGKARAFSAPFGGTPVSSGWSTGNVGIWGKSHDGWLANGIATTGVEGLKAVVSIAGVTDIYQTYNDNGAWVGTYEGGPPLYNERAQKLCKPLEAELARQKGTSGDWNRYWQERHYPSKASSVRAAVFATQGFNDLAVKPTNFSQWWEALRVPRKAWLFQGGHADPFDLRRADYVETVGRWFDRWLLGVPNGVEREPAVKIEHAVDEWRDEPTWPAPGNFRTWWPKSDGTLSGTPSPGTTTFQDDPSVGRFEWLSDDSLARVLYTSPPLTTDTRLSGVGTVTVTMKSSTPVARVGVLVVDYGPAVIRNVDFTGKVGIRNLDTRSCWGSSSDVDSACYLDTVPDTVSVDREIVSVAWADLGHYASRRHQVPLRADRYYTMRFDLSPLDHIVPAGHRLGLIIGGTDYWEFLTPGDRPTLTVNLSQTSLTLPTAH